MNNSIEFVIQKSRYRSLFLDLSALLFIYFIPVLSHLSALPLYFLEPMRIMVILAIVHTSRKNAFILAVTLPVFSFLVSAHPSIIKSTLILTELVLNVWLFYFFAEKFRNIFVSMLISIILGKVMYYSFKFILINFAVMTSEVVATPLIIQFITTILFSSYIMYFLNSKKGLH